MRMLRFADSPSTASSLEEGIAREELAGLAYMFWGRLIALGLLAIWVALTLPFERSGSYLLAIAAFALLGARRDQDRTVRGRRDPVAIWFLAAT